MRIPPLVVTRSLLQDLCISPSKSSCLPLRNGCLQEIPYQRPAELLGAFCLLFFFPPPIISVPLFLMTQLSNPTFTLSLWPAFSLLSSSRIQDCDPPICPIQHQHSKSQKSIPAFSLKADHSSLTAKRKV